MRKAARALAKAYDAALSPCALKSTQFPILVALHAKGPTRIQDLAETLALDRTTLTRNLVPLQRRGLIRDAEGSDPPFRTLRLTEAGEALLQEALPYWQKLQERLVASLGAERAEQLRTELRDLAAATER
ncbi:MAG: winged helix-turn-helix transcriptional regulator [Deltaproteobacteria bacterium]|nr:winged helix-turn-helix transcriptional regulator [Deltaproteobacteria bacterium]